MPIYYDDSMRCTKCSSSHFLAEKVYQFHSKAIKRITPFERENEVTPVSVEIIYYCKNCGTELEL